MTPVTTAEHKIAAADVEELSERLREPAWFREFRVQAWRSYEQLPAPHPQDEAWRWIEPARRDVTGFPPSARVTPRIDGVPNGRGVVAVDWATALAQHPALVQSFFMRRALKPQDGKLQALHAACLNGAAFIYVPRNVQADQPIRVSWQFDEAERGYFPHLLVIAEEGSRVCIIEEYASPPAMPLHNVAGVELLAGCGAHVTYGAVQALGSGATHFGFQRMLLSRDAQLQSVFLSLGAALTRQQIEAVAEEPGSSSELLGFRVGKGDQQCHVVSLQDHLAPHTTSDLLFKSALHDSAQASYYGMIRIHQDAQKCNAYQQDRNLLLGEHARANSTPILEIEADDVRCTHGASVGPVDEEQLFYLRARGISPAVAETMLVYGFVEEALARIKEPELRGLCTQRLASAVGALDLMPQEV